MKKYIFPITVVTLLATVIGLQIYQINYAHKVDSDIQKYSTDSRYIIDSIEQDLRGNPN